MTVTNLRYIRGGRQSKKMSLVEAFANVAIGYAVALAAQLAIFPVFNIHVPIKDNLAIGAFFTVVSIVRSYAVRRLFNNMGHRRKS